jgi:hypothetical protein
MTFGKYYVAIECHVSDVRLSGQLCRYLRHVENLFLGYFQALGVQDAFWSHLKSVTCYVLGR